MDRAERQAAHAVGGTWMPSPEAHLQNERDAYHFDWTIHQLRGLHRCSILDIGAYDGWLDFLLMREGHKVEGVELDENLCKSAMGYAQANNLQYTVHQGFFEDVEITHCFDVAACFETLEHVPIEMVPVYVAKMEVIATKRILISLPDQKHQDNPQHLWTPSFDLIRSMWGHKKGFELTYKPYPNIPASFMIRWDK